MARLCLCGGACDAKPTLGTVLFVLLVQGLDDRMRRSVT